ncbi:MAG: hypothetical protein LDL39_18115 [Magnetospirillum sp.]|nr:hypothetical protein [Magnetospirillum sp.]
MKRLAALFLLLAAPALAAESWGLPEEKAASFDAKVVDMVCQLTGDCPTKCGAGKRQLGLLTNDGKLILVSKNADPFAGASTDLAPYCGQTITADGLFTTNQGVTLFALQRLKPKAGQWRDANGFTQAWGKDNQRPGDSGEWYLHDARVKALIGQQGKLGLGPGVTE